MNVGLDTSVVLRLLTGMPRAQYELARQYVQDSATSVAVSDLVVAESYYALLHHYKISHADAVQSLFALLSDSRITALGTAARVLRELSLRSSAKAVPGLIDRLIHADYVRDDVALATFDRDLARLDGVQLLGA